MAKTIFEELSGKYERQGDYLVSAEQLKILINTEFSSIFCYNNCMEQRYNRFIFLQNSYKSQEMPCIRHQIKASPHYLILTSPSDSG